MQLRCAAGWDERELDGARSRAAEATEDAANLRLELESRPTVRDWRAAQRRVGMLETRLEEAERALQGSSDQRALRNYVRLRDHAAAKGGAAASAPPLPTAELMRRDKENHRQQQRAQHLLRRRSAQRASPTRVFEVAVRTARALEIHALDKARAAAAT